MKFVHARDRIAIRRDLQLRCQVIRGKDHRLIGARTVDLSTDGLLVRSEGDIAVGDPVIVSFRATDFDIRFDAEGEVTRILHGRRDYDRGRCLGVRFDLKGAVHRHILRGHLRRVPPTLPRRVSRVDYAETVRRIDLGWKTIPTTTPRLAATVTPPYFDTFYYD